MKKTEISTHPLKPFLPTNMVFLMLGSFPPVENRWSMNFYYPNYQNDMWRIFGKVFFGDVNHFIVTNKKAFDADKIKSFLEGKGIGIYDAAVEVQRGRCDSSDKFLHIYRSFDITSALLSMPKVRTVAATGQKAAQTIASAFGCGVPLRGDCLHLSLNITQSDKSSKNGKYSCYNLKSATDSPILRGDLASTDKVSKNAGLRYLDFYRMPSTSRAYPLSFEEKVKAYADMFIRSGLL